MRICEDGRGRGCLAGGCGNDNIIIPSGTTTTTSVPCYQNGGDHSPQPQQSLLGPNSVSAGTHSSPNHVELHRPRITNACSEKNGHLQNITRFHSENNEKNISTSGAKSIKNCNKENDVLKSPHRLHNDNNVQSCVNTLNPSLQYTKTPTFSASSRGRAKLSHSSSSHSHLFPVLLALLVLFASCSDACAPRGGSGTRRHRRKLTPLVFKQHVPNVSENTLGASGQADGPIKREDAKFKDLVRNNNKDIWFRDEEHTGADRMMSKRCKDKLNILAISVLNQWPGVKLRVTEAWDENNSHASNSLHYEGRAVDITTSDLDRTKYGMLARLAVEAGFDWVYYESRSHVHCSVKSDSSVAINFGGCYPADSLVHLPGGGTKPMSEVKVGDRVLSTQLQDGTLVYSDVVAFLDRNPARTAVFYTVHTVSGRSLTLTGKHLVYYLTPQDVQLGGVGNQSSAGRKEPFPHGRVAYADELQVGQYLLQVYPSSERSPDPKQSTPVRLLGDISRIATQEESADISSELLSDTASAGNRLVPERIVSIATNKRQGVFAPLTAQGTVVVDGYVTSCYAFLKDVNLAHNVMAPVRAYHVIKLRVKDWLNTVVQPVSAWLVCWLCPGLSPALEPSKSPQNVTSVSEMYSEGQLGAHWYAQMLYRIAINVLGMDIFISI